MENYNFYLCTSPLSQFEISEILTLDFTIGGNLTRHIKFLDTIELYLTISSVLIILMCLLSINLNKIISNNFSITQESFFATILNVVKNQINGKNGQVYFPFIFSLFIFILINNLIGLIPYSFSVTAHFAVVLSLSFIVVLGSTILGLYNNGWKFFSIFVPSGCPLPLLPLLVMIEAISYAARCISLGLRLGANIFSGHLLLTILSGFTYKIMTLGFIYFLVALFPLAFIIAFSTLELAIAFIQSIVFVILACSYVKDGLELHTNASVKSSASKI